MHRLAERLRAARQAQGLSIRQAAQRVGCSPRFVHQLEQGKATARMDKVMQALSGLGLAIAVGPERGVLPEPEWKARLEARAKQRLHEVRLARAHERIAAKLALGELGPEALARARAQVGKWQEQRICSDWYIGRWTEILRGPAARIASRLLELDPAEANALFQNTPFGFLVRPEMRA